jgi:hypothetical protein
MGLFGNDNTLMATRIHDQNYNRMIMDRQREADNEELERIRRSHYEFERQYQLNYDKYGESIAKRLLRKEAEELMESTGVRGFSTGRGVGEEMRSRVELRRLIEMIERALNDKEHSEDKYEKYINRFSIETRNRMDYSNPFGMNEINLRLTCYPKNGGSFTLCQLGRIDKLSHGNIIRAVEELKKSLFIQKSIRIESLMGKRKYLIAESKELGEYCGEKKGFKNYKIISSIEDTKGLIIKKNNRIFIRGKAFGYSKNNIYKKEFIELMNEIDMMTDIC